MKKVGTILLSIIFVFLSLSNIEGQDNTFCVCDAYTNTKQEFKTYKSAYTFYKENIDNYDNLFIQENDKTILMEYGVVQFSSEINKYYSINRKQYDYITGSYTADGAYIKSDDDYVYFKISDDIGKISKDLINLVPFDNDIKISVYNTDEEYIYHNISKDVNSDFYAYSIKLDYIPSYLDTNSTYYSYDGHYFYDDFYVMINDYRNNNHHNCINSKGYYNYFQYLPYRSISNYSKDDIENYLSNVLMYDGKLDSFIDLNLDDGNDLLCKSQLFNEADSFINAQNLYGCNAMLLLSSGINDSYYGKSLNSYTTNNLYRTSAFRYNQELENNRYNCISDSIYSYAKNYISNKLCNHYLTTYCGNHLGNKAGGINIEYSLDPYCGEKVASIYFDIDNKLENKDNNANCIGIILDNEKVKLYKNNSLNESLYSLYDINELSYVIIEDVGNAYKVLLDENINEDIYDYSNNVAYINKDEFAIILNEDKIYENEYVTVNYDFNGGYFDDKDSLQIQLKKGSIASNIIPNKDGYEFIGYDKKIDTLYEDISYVAEYKQIELIDITSINQKQINPINLKNCNIYVLYKDSSFKQIPATSNMIRDISYDEDGNGQLIIDYCGVSDSISFSVDDNYYSSYELMNNAINDLDYRYIKNNLMNNYPYQINDIRNLDIDLFNLNDRNYVINNNNNTSDFSISGLDLSLDHRISFSLIKDTYYVDLNSVSNADLAKVSNLASAYGFDYVSDLNIDFKFNYESIKLNGPCVVSIGKDNTTNYIYTVYHINDNGDISKCECNWSNNNVKFIIYEAGDYVIFKKASFNNYVFDDIKENLNIDNMGYDNHRLNIEVMVATILILISFIGVIVYYIALNIKEKTWKEFKNSLHNQDTVVEEKQKN